MDLILFLMFLLFLISFVIEIIEPDLKKTRKRILVFLGTGTILCLVLFMSNTGYLNDAKDSPNKLLTIVEEKIIPDKKIASDLDIQINALGDVNSITLDKSTNVQTVRSNYESLTEHQKSLVTKFDILKVAETNIAALQEVADKAADEAKKAAAEEEEAAQIAAFQEVGNAIFEVDAETSNSSTSTSTPSQNNEYTVYVTETGSKYHRNGCRYLAKSKIAILKSEAIGEGYSPCSVCNP